MDFKLVSDDRRKIRINMELVDTYTGRYKPGTSYDVSVTRRQAKVSDPMRKYYFAAVVPPLMEELGYNQYETLFFHQQLKIRYFEYHPDFLGDDGEPTIKQDGRGIWRNVPSVFGKDSKMDVSVKKAFVDEVVRWASFYGIYIEDPG